MRGTAQLREASSVPQYRLFYYGSPDYTQNISRLLRKFISFDHNIIPLNCANVKIYQPGALGAVSGCANQACIS
jgi:hypothetical protein